jgi:hypothetical protein
VSESPGVGTYTVPKKGSVGAASFSRSSRWALQQEPARTPGVGTYGNIRTPRSGAVHPPAGVVCAANLRRGSGSRGAATFSSTPRFDTAAEGHDAPGVGAYDGHISVQFAPA